MSPNQKIIQERVSGWLQKQVSPFFSVAAGLPWLLAAAAPAPATDPPRQWKLDEFFNRSIVQPGTLVGALFYAAIFLVLAYVICALIRKAVHRIAVSKRHLLMDPTLVQFFGELAQVVVYVFAVLLYAHLIPALNHLGTALLASVSVASLVIGLAAQQALSNLIAGLSLLLYRPFRLGDRLQIAIPGGSETGSVESLDLGYTVLRTDDQRRIIVPNSVMAAQVTLNVSGRKIPGSWYKLVFALKNGSEVERARHILKTIAQNKVAGENPTEVTCLVTAVTSASTELTLSVPCATPEEIPVKRSELLLEAKSQLEAAGVPFN